MPPGPRRLLLFDIDGTLVRWGGVAGRVFARALQKIVGRSVDTAGYSFAGRTDLEIARTLLRRAGIAPDQLDESVQATIEEYLRGFADLVHDQTKATLCPGVRSLLQRLDAEPMLTLGLLTGNVSAGADLKLGHFDIRHYFRLGAFGSDSEDRNDLLPIALRRARERTGIEFQPRQVVIIGDTPRDIECARAHGAMSVGVATGPYTREELQTAGALHVVDDLADTGRVARLLLDGTALTDRAGEL